MLDVSKKSRQLLVPHCLVYKLNTEEPNEYKKSSLPEELYCQCDSRYRSSQQISWYTLADAAQHLNTTISKGSRIAP